MMKISPILSIIEMANQYGLITDFAGIVLHCNSLLGNALQYPVLRLEDVFGAQHVTVLQKIQDAVAGRTMVTLEFEMDFGNGISQVFGQVYPLQTDTGYLSMILFHPLDNLQRLEGAFFARKSKLPTDSRWVVDADYNTIKFNADPDSIFYGRKAGFSLFEAIQIKDHAVLQSAFARAALSPGEIVTRTVGARRRHGKCRIEVDIIHGPDMFYGDRYYVMTRPAINRTLGILVRMAEAYQVVHDKDLAVRLGVVPSSVSNVRTQNREVPPAWIIQCVLDCKVRFRWIYGGVGEKYFEGFG